MSRRDPGAANGGPVREPRRCRNCGRMETLHVLTRSGRRGGFPAADCPGYDPQPDCCRCDPELCATDDTGEHCDTQSCGVCLHGCPAPVGVPCCREEM